MAKELKNVSAKSKERERYASQTKPFMSELRKLVRGCERGKELVGNSLIDLAGIVPELPAILKKDAGNQDNFRDVVQMCTGYREGLTNTCRRKRNSETHALFKSQVQRFRELLESLDLPESYDDLATIVERTRISPPAPKGVSYNLGGLPDEWRARIEEQISAFGLVEQEIVSEHRSWLTDNGFDPDAKCGGWDPLDHQRFLLCGEKNAMVEFKEKGSDEVNRHKRWVIRAQFLTRKKESLRVELLKRVDEMRNEAKRDMQSREEKARADMAADERRKALADEKDELNARLVVERKDRDERDAAKAAQREQEMKEKADDDKRQKGVVDKRKAELKKRVLSERERKQQAETDAAERRRKAAEREKEIQKLRMKEAKVHVGERKQMLQDKQKLKAEHDAARVEAEADKKRRLDALAQSVRDEFGLDGLEADPARLTKLQEMRRHMDKEERPLFFATSFASSVIEADPRIRVETALRQAGLMDSPYAQQVIRQMAAIRTNQTMSSNVPLG